MKQLILPRCLNEGETHKLSSSDAHHLVRVRRMTVGDRIAGLDTHGNAYTLAIESVESATVVVRCVHRMIATRDPSRRRLGVSEESTVPPVDLALALLKGKKNDLVIRQATELGVATIRLVDGDHSVGRLNREDWPKKQTRWQTIIKEAVEQSGRSTIPRILPPLPIQELVGTVDPGVAFHQSAQPVSLRESLSRLLADYSPNSLPVLIGPEGGLSGMELKLLANSHWEVTALPTPVLRSETAVVAAVSIVISSLYG